MEMVSQADYESSIPPSLGMVDGVSESHEAENPSELQRSPSDDFSEGKELNQDPSQNNQHITTTTTENSVANVQSPPVQLIPLLRGTMTYIGGVVYCKGKWGMSKEAHNIPGQTSDFEFKLMQAEDGGGHYPVNGKYQGWFHVKQQKGHYKVEDKEMNIAFTSNEDATHTIAGEGHNKFGKFYLRGKHHADGSVEIFRDYYLFFPQTIPPIPLKRAKSEPEKKKIDTKIVEEATTPRESLGRIRKQSSVLREYQETMQKVKPEIATPRSADAPTSSSVSFSLQQKAGLERTHRLNSTMKKCADLLRELSKYPQALWFLEPVDPIALNIPDYPKIVKNPMDFSTIRKNIETSSYEGINDFAAHMRLVFRNAITFNQARDNPVHIAAREMSERFETRFRQLVAQLAPEDYPVQVEAKSSSSTKAVGSSKKSSAKGKEGPSSMKTPRGAGSIPKQTSFQYLPPIAVDGSTQKILEMQRMMESMKDEIEQLRATVRVQEAHKFVQDTKTAAQNPLTLEEKKSLIAAIHKLPPYKMEKVLDIIQKSLPPGADQDGEIQVPLDSLDTLTLRKLQNFIQDNATIAALDNKKYKRSISQASLNRSKSESGGTNTTKKPKKQRTSSVPMNTSTATSSALDEMQVDDENDHDLDIFGHDDDPLLFDDAEAFGDDEEGGGLKYANETKFSQHDYDARLLLQEQEEDNNNRDRVTSSRNMWIQAKEAVTEEVNTAGTTLADEEDDNDDGWNTAAAELRAKNSEADGDF